MNKPKKIYCTKFIEFNANGNSKQRFSNTKLIDNDICYILETEHLRILAECDAMFSEYIDAAKSVVSDKNKEIEYLKKLLPKCEHCKGTGNSGGLPNIGLMCSGCNGSGFKQNKP